MVSDKQISSLYKDKLSEHSLKFFNDFLLKEKSGPNQLAAMCKK